PGRNREIYGAGAPRDAGWGRGAQAESEPRRSGSSGRFEDFTSELGRKFDAIARDMEPKIQRFTDQMAEKTVQLADRLSKSLSADDASRGAPRTSPDVPRASQSPAASAAPYASGAASANEKRYELQVSPGYNELSVSGINGNVLIRGYNGDKITAKVFFKAKRGVPASSEVNFMRLGSKYYLNYDEENYERVEIDAYVPESMFNVVNIRGRNGTVDISTLRAERIEIENANGQVKLKELTADAITAECSNGPLSLSRIFAEKAEFETYNGLIDALDLDAAGLKMSNTNGGVTVNISSLTRYADYVWNVETSNGKLTANLPTMPDLGYHIRAHNTLGSVKVGLTGLTYTVNEADAVEAKSLKYDTCPKKARLAFETSNGPLTLN
ncbi:MAG: DUF4097 family beta strand repeat-containing protein, partial [Firmicutes bacterium]|nr:DUF4097 family beta strand repeat-containing protein [Bacillota bacterium]